MNRLLIGSGDKNALLLQLLCDDFSNGVTIIDPSGDLSKLAANCLPAGLTERTVYFDPTNPSHIVGLNVLSSVPLTERHRVTEQLCGYFESMWPNGWGAQSNFILANCLRLLLEQPRSTLLDVLTLLADPTSASPLLARTADPVLRINWKVITTWDRRQYQGAVAPLQNKIGTLLLSPAIRNIVGQKDSTFGRADIIIADLNRSTLGDTTSKLLGGLLITRQTGSIVINDYGFFSAPLPLPEERFTLTLNYLDELPSRIQQLVLGIEEKFVFKTAHKDAEELAFHVGLLNPRILTDLGSGKAYNRSAGHIWPQLPASGKRLKPLRNRTRAYHTRPVNSVERAIDRYFAVGD